MYSTYTKERDSNGNKTLRLKITFKSTLSVFSGLFS